MNSLVCKDHESCPLMINFAVKCPKFRWTVDGGRSLNARSKMRIPKVQILLKLSRNYVDTSPSSLTLQWAWILIRGRGCQAAQIWSPATQRPGMQGDRDRTEAGGGEYILRRIIDKHYQIYWSDLLAIKYPCHVPFVPSLTMHISGLSGESSSRVEQEILVRVRGQRREIS